MQISSDQYGQVLGLHYCSDGFKWIITEEDQDSPYHGYLFAPGGDVLAHFHHKSYMSIESQLKSFLSYYRAGTDFATAIVADKKEVSCICTSQNERSEKCLDQN